MNLFEMPADVRQNIFYTLYFIVLHNFWAIIYVIGMVTSISLALYRPTRAYILFFLGFTVLFFNFEYNKHIAEGLREQTLNSLVTERASATIPRILNIALIRLPPLILPLIGWGLILLAIWLIRRKPKHHG